MNAAHQVFKTKQTHRLLFRDVRRLVGAVLFPTRNSRWRLSAVVALGLLITILELVTAHSFGYLINRVNDFERAQALFLTILFLIGFLGTRLFHYAHNIARLKLLNSTESEIETLSPVAETWRWPLGISAMTLMTLHARILFIGLQIITISRLFSLLYFAAYLFASVVNYVFIQRQYTVHLDFHQRRGSHHPAAASEKVITRVSAAERSAFLGFVLLPFLIATLIYEVAQDVVSLSGAVILFFSLKMFSSLSATVSSMNMQFVRAYVFVNNEFTPDRDTLKETTEPKSTEQDEKELKAGQRSAHLDGISSLGMSPTQDFAHLLATGETEYDLTEISAYHSDALSLSPSRSGRRARQATVLRTTKPALLWRVVEVKHSRHAGTLESERHFVLQDSYSGFLLYVSTEQQSANDQVFSTHVRNTFESLGKFAPVRVITMTQDVDN